MNSNSVCQISNDLNNINIKNNYCFGILFIYLDYVFDENCNTKLIYEKVGKSIINDVLNGINGTLFAYGQTSSGKTYTIQGNNTNPGMLYLAIDDIFNKIANVFIKYIRNHLEII